MRQTVMNFQHNKMAQFMSRVTQNDSDMFVRCHCDFNCSYENDVDQAPHHDHLAVARKALFQQWTAIDRNGVRQNFGYLHDIFASWYKV